jgi:Carboxypeptidase regulatory-like domain
MLILGLVVSLIFLTAPAHAEPSQAGAPSSQLSGRVVEEGTGAPVSSARVILLAQPRNAPEPVPQAITDQDGRYTFEGVAPGRYRVNVLKGGILPPADPANVPTVILAAGQVINDWSVSVQKGGAIAGRILDPFGEPLVDVTVRAVRRNAPGAGSSQAIVNSTPSGDLRTATIPTNDLGEFRVFGLAPGEYVITASPPPVLGLQNISATLLASTFYPGVSEAMAAQPIAVTAGETVGGVEFRLLTTPAFRVSGVVVDQAGAPVAGARVMLRADSRFDQRGVLNMGPASQIISDASGRFVFGNIPSGLYSVIASVIVSSGGSRGTDPIAVRIDDANIDDLRIVVQEQ